MNKTLILQKALSIGLIVVSIICTILLHDVSMLIFCAPFYLSGLFSKESVLNIHDNEGGGDSVWR